MLEGKIAIVTGGATGIGAATSRLLAAQGAHVVLTSEQPLAVLDEFRDQLISSGGSASAVSCDVTDENAVSSLIEIVDRRHGRLDILINCAGVCFQSNIENMPVSQITTTLNVNLLGPILLTRAALPIMRRSGEGAIVNVASGAALLGVEGLTVYSATKAALMQFTRTMAPELRRSGIRMNTVGPGSTRTQMLGFVDETLTEAQSASLVKRTAATVSPYGNALIEPVDIANVIMFLVSDASRALQGSFIVADQGLTGAIPVPG